VTRAPSRPRGARRREVAAGLQMPRATWPRCCAAPGLRLNEHVEADGPTVFAHACRMGLEGIVSKRKTSTYRRGRSPDWLKSKNPACQAVRREAEEVSLNGL
jgi:ATP-dependent DNA ligase